ncbi:MAG: hypothetical protein JNK82_21880 [Myxococcaceae bacterium]|nr:hypothetical protein [Myxococcaceae bacterium]
MDAVVFGSSSSQEIETLRLLAAKGGKGNPDVMLANSVRAPEVAAWLLSQKPRRVAVKGGKLDVTCARQGDEPPYGCWEQGPARPAEASESS